jgi:hypothetical protein
MRGCEGRCKRVTILAAAAGPAHPHLGTARTLDRFACILFSESCVMKSLLAFAVLLPLAVTAAQAQSSPQTAQAANAEAAAQAAAPTPADSINAANQAQYQSDLARYEQVLHANHRDAMRDRAHYNHQQRAYADAMAAWRQQAYACQHGNTRACNAPTPDPADFY